MATAPFLVVADGERFLEVADGDRRYELRLSDRAEAMLVDRGYENRDTVPWTVARAFVLADAATHPERDARELDAGLGGAGGGASPSEEDLRALADYLRSVTVPDETVATLREHVTDTGLSRFLDSGDVGGRADTVGDLSDIARDL
jgi:hypothetical protein